MTDAPRPRLPLLRPTGFTLVELMVVVALVAIITALAAPSWKDLIVNNRTRAAVNDWIASQQFARSEALRLNLPVTLCPSTDGTDCSTVSTDGFEVGWIVKTELASVAGILLQDNLPNPSVSMALSSASNTAMTFLPNGLPASNFAGARLLVRDSDLATPARLNKFICIARTGRTRVFTQAEWLALVGAGSCGP